MAKKIIFCADGTWEHPVNPGVAEPVDTNVYKLFKALLKSPAQAPFYDDGVGAETQLFRHLFSGATGEGLFKKVRDGYSDVARSYEDGDAIYLFGFSRGAYTARSLGGMIAACGLPLKSKFSPQAVGDAFIAYRATDSDHRDVLMANLLKNYGNRSATIAMIGVWDTVGALGIPGFIFAGLNAQKYGFLNTSLSPAVQKAYQALSIDERRREFVPTLWLPSPIAPRSQLIEQIWFAGTHCDVGGGYAQTELSDLALAWMISKARQNGLEFDAGAIAAYQLPMPAGNSLGVLHDSWQFYFGFPKSRTIPAGATLANSVQIRLGALDGYRPDNVSLTPENQLEGYSSVSVVA